MPLSISVSHLTTLFARDLQMVQAPCDCASQKLHRIYATLEIPPGPCQPLATMPGSGLYVSQAERSMPGPGAARSTGGEPPSSCGTCEARACPPEQTRGRVRSSFLFKNKGMHAGWKHLGKHAKSRPCNLHSASASRPPVQPTPTRRLVWQLSVVGSSTRVVL